MLEAGFAERDYARKFVHVAGPERLVGASDCPFVGSDASVSADGGLARALPVPKPSAILGETVLRFYLGAGAARRFRGDRHFVGGAR